MKFDFLVRTTSKASPKDINKDWMDFYEGITHFGTNGNDKAIGSNYGDDTFFGSYGADFYDGRGGSDTVDHRYSGSGVWVNLEDGLGAFGTASGDRYNDIENVIGSSYADVILGSDADNRIESKAGSDLIFSSLGNDFIDGGSGKDILSYQNSDHAIQVNLAQNFVNVEQGGYTDTVVNVETVRGSNFNDNFVGDGANNTFYGYDGDDNFIADAGRDTYYGGNGSDTIIATGHNQTINLQNRTGSYGDVEGDKYFSIENITMVGVNNRAIGDDNANVISTSGIGARISALGGDDHVIIHDYRNSWIDLEKGNDVISFVPENQFDQSADQFSFATVKGGAGFDAVDLGLMKQDVYFVIDGNNSAELSSNINSAFLGDPFVSLSEIERVKFGAGDDYIHDASSVDMTYTGAEGVDQYYLDFNIDAPRHTTITDFDTNGDILGIHLFQKSAGIDIGFDLLSAGDAYWEDTSQGVLFRFAESTLLLEGIQISDLGADDFAFG